MLHNLATQSCRLRKPHLAKRCTVSPALHTFQTLALPAIKSIFESSIELQTWGNFSQNMKSFSSSESLEYTLQRII